MSTINFSIVIIFLGLEIVVGGFIAFYYSCLYHDWMEFNKQKRIFDSTVREWKRLKEAIKINIEKKKTRNIVDII